MRYQYQQMAQLRNIQRRILKPILRHLNSYHILYYLNDNFIEETGLKKSLTPSRSNGFLNILIKMKSQANEFLNTQ